jgi:putrescine transport system ATP-binding protein
MDLQSRLGLTFIIVTHDQDEAMTLADRIGVMNHGKLVQVAPPGEVYEQPNSRWVADFIGDINLIEGRTVAGEPGAIESAAGRLRVAQPAAAAPGVTVWVAVRPEKVAITTTAPAAGQGNSFAGTVADIAYLGDVSVYKVRLDGGLVLEAIVANRTRLIERPIGWDDRVWLSFAPEAAVVLTQ